MRGITRKIIVFATIDEADPKVAEIFEQALQDGVEGIKLLSGHPKFYDEPLNSENAYKVYQIVAEYEVPVLLHGSIITIPGLKDQVDQAYSDFPKAIFIQVHYGSTIMNGINLD
jgi:predicted TIM-barrel fold metal-dependent hydrolase